MLPNVSRLTSDGYIRREDEMLVGLDGVIFISEAIHQNTFSGTPEPVNIRIEERDAALD